MATTATSSHTKTIIKSLLDLLHTTYTSVSHKVLSEEASVGLSYPIN